jgi:hypothetical protein
MRLLKRILLVLLLLLLLGQLPFVYRRYRLGQVAAKIAETGANREPPQDSRYREYKGIIHAHTSLGGHSTGNFDELIGAANANDLDFVLMTEHWSDQYDTSALTLNGVYGKTLFVGGNEIDTADGDRFLMIPGSADAAGLRKMPTSAVLDKLHGENRQALITYPEKFKSWDSNFDGIEVFSLHTAAKRANPLLAMFDLLWSYPAYPQLTLMRYFQRPDENLAKFDEIASKRPISLFAGTDAHSNIGFHIFGDEAGNKLINIKIDPYETIFRIARVHVLIENDRQLDRESLLEAMKAGQYFVGFDAMGDSTGFSFELDEKRDPAAPGLVRLSVLPPQMGTRMVLYRNGIVLADETLSKPSDDNLRDNNLEVGRNFQVSQGVYRVELYRTDLGPPFDQMPWIISNPIYVR